MRSIFIVIVTLIFITFQSCKVQCITEQFRIEDSHVPLDVNASAIIIADSIIDIYDFQSSFKNLYPDNKSFTSAYLDNFIKKLNDEKMFSNINNGNTSENFERIITPNNKNGNITVENKSTINNIRYSIEIVGFKIDKNIMHESSSGGPKKTIFCIVIAQFKVKNSDTGEEISNFDTKSMTTVKFFAYDSALKKAIKQSIRYAVKYLKTGKKNYY